MALLGPAAIGVDLGFGDAAQAFAATAPPFTSPLAIVFCPKSCTVRVSGRLVLAGGSARSSRAPTRGFALTRRTLKVSAAKPGIVRLALTKSQRSGLATARRASVVLTLVTTLGRASRTAHVTLRLRHQRDQHPPRAGQ